MTYDIVIYEAKDGWRWRLVAENGKIVADGAEAYDSKSNAHRAVGAVVTATWKLPEQ